MASVLGHAEHKFAWLDDIRAECTWVHPIVIPSLQGGGYTAIWEHIGEKLPEDILGFPPRHYFYRVVDAAGKMIITRGEFEFWRTPQFPTHKLVLFNQNSLLWLDANRLLILGWKIYYPSARLERVVMDANGVLIAGPDSARESAVGERAVLSKDSKGRAYAFASSSGIWAMSVYPRFSKATTMSRQELREFYARFPPGEFRIDDKLTCIITSKDKLLICNRLGWGDTPRNKRGLWHLYRPDSAFYIMADLEGNYVSEPVVFSVVDFAFRKIPGPHLGGYYQAQEGRPLDEAQAVEDDLDLSRLPDGRIILSITGEDENGELCVYQIGFSADGRLQKPQETEVVSPRTFPEDRILPVSTVTWAYGAYIHLVIFGFDEYGNFYKDSKVWKETTESMK